MTYTPIINPDNPPQVPLPDEAARRAILGARLRRVPVVAGVDVEALAALTHGLSGADLAEVVRRAGQLALRSVQGRTLLFSWDSSLEILRVLEVVLWRGRLWRGQQVY